MDKIIFQRNFQKKIKEIFFKELPSTQIYCRENYSNLLSKEKTWHLIIAETQTNGIGQEERKWESQSKNIYCTFVIPMKSSFLMFFNFIPLIVVYSIAKVLKKYGVDAKVKWINDVHVNNKKIGGILCESFTIGLESVVLIGIGINTNMTQDEIDKLIIDQEITSLAVEMGNVRNIEKLKNENQNLLNTNFNVGNENSSISNDVSNTYNFSAGHNYNVFSFNQNLQFENKNNKEKDNDINNANNNEIKIALENGIYLKTTSDNDIINMEIDNKVLIESLKYELFENINKILCLDHPETEINYDDIKLNFTVFALNPLRFFISNINKSVMILNTQFNNRTIIGRFLGLDEDGFAKIREKGSNEIFSVTKGRMQPIRNLLKDKWNDKENLKILEIDKIKFNNKSSFWQKHYLISHNKCIDKRINTIPMDKIFNSDIDEFNYILEGTITDRLGNNLFVYGDFIEKKDISKDDEKEIFKINLFFDLEKSEIKSDFTGYINKDHHLEEFNLKRFYNEIYLKGIFNPEKEILCFSYCSDNKDFNIMEFVKNYNNKNQLPDNEMLLNNSCTEKYERTIKMS